MATIAAEVKQAGRKVSRVAAARVRSPLFEKIARAGYAAKGVVYVLVGALAAKAAFAGGGQVGGSSQGLSAIIAQGSGAWILVLVVGVGLIAYALWNLSRALFDVEDEGDDIRAYWLRAGWFISAAVHALLGVSAIVAALHGRSTGGDGQGARGLVGTMLAWPGGRVLVAGIGIGIAIYGLFQLYRAYVIKLEENLDLSKVRATPRRWIIRLGRFGLAARGVVMPIVGYLFVYAAWTHDSGQAGGLGEALRTLQRGWYGWIVLGIVALGLVAYGLYMFSVAAYRRIDVKT
jgi:hypothetical protein